MVYEFRFPDVGEGITEGELVAWKVRVGDKVKEDQIIADVETDKALVQIPSPVSGVILKINFNKGDTIKVGAVMVVIGEQGESVTQNKNERLEEKVSERKDVSKKSVGVVGELEEADDVDKAVAEARKEIQSSIKPKQESAVDAVDRIVGRVLAMPRVKQLAKDIGVDLSQVPGTGSHGQITESDVRSSKGKGTSEVKKEIQHVRKYDMYGYVTRVPLKGVRKAIAKNMEQSATEIPHVSHVDKVDMTALVQVREREKVSAEKKGVTLTYMPFIIKAIIAALKEHPSLNSSLEDDGLGNQDIVMKKYYNIGVAVDTEEGLMVPVLKGAERKSIIAIAKEIAELAEKARKREINLGDLRGGTFTITNYGSIGGLFGTPIINYPEAAILGLGRMIDEPVVVHGKIDTRKVMYLTLSFDHRILDGAEAARFMNKLISYLQDPDSLLVEM